MGPGRDWTRDPWIWSQTRICSQTRYWMRYVVQIYWWNLELFSGFLKKKKIQFYAFWKAFHLSKCMKLYLFIFFFQKKNYIFSRKKKKSKKNKYICVPTLPKIVRPVIWNTLVFIFIWTSDGMAQSVNHYQSILTWVFLFDSFLFDLILYVPSTIFQL